MRRRVGLGLAILCVGPGAALAGALPHGTTLHVSSHLARGAKVQLDGGGAATAPGYGSTNLNVAAGAHTLKVTTAAGVTYSASLNLKPADLMVWRGRGYWCVNLLERSLETYSKEECQEEVTDAG